MRTCLSIGVLALALALAGCANEEQGSTPGDPKAPTAEPKTGATPDENPQESAPEKKETQEERGIEIPRTINATPGEATRLGPPPKREKLWTVRWKEARINFGDEGRFSGFMERVTGSIYSENGKVASTFQGQNGEADKAKDILRLSGQIKIISNEYKASLFCDKVEYQPARKLIRAVGDVRVESESGVLNAGNEVLATPDLKRIATPNLF